MDRSALSVRPAMRLYRPHHFFLRGERQKVQPAGRITVSDVGLDCIHRHGHGESGAVDGKINSTESLILCQSAAAQRMGLGVGPAQTMATRAQLLAND